MLRTDTHKKPLRDIAVHGRFTYNRTEKAFATNLPANSGGGELIDANPLFDITHKIVIVAKFQRSAVCGHVQAVFFLRNVRAIPRYGLVMAFAPIVRITVPFIGIFAAL